MGTWTRLCFCHHPWLQAVGLEFNLDLKASKSYSQFWESHSSSNTKVYMGDDKNWILVLLCKLWTMLSHKTAIHSMTAVLPKLEGLPCFSILFAFKKSHCLDQTCSHSSSHYCKCLHAGDNVSPAIFGATIGRRAVGEGWFCQLHP